MKFSAHPMLDAARLRALDESQHDSGAARLAPLPRGRIWVVVQSHPGAERWAAANLLRSGYPVYLPLHAVTRRDPVTRSMTRTVEVPLFGNYLFAEMDNGSPWTPIRYTQGVRCLLMADGKPGHVDATLLDAVRASEAARRTTPTDPTAGWHPGASCAVANGALAGHHGVVVRTTASHAVVALMLLGRLVEASVRLDALARPAA
jgi:transcription antitermination factor NusG